MALPKDVKFVTFDCYGTLIDWETGVYDAFQKEADRDGFTVDRDALVPRFVEVQREIQRGSYELYAEVLRRTAVRVASELGWDLEPSRSNFLPNSVPAWPPSGDQRPARALRQEVRGRDPLEHRRQAARRHPASPPHRLRPRGHRPAGALLQARPGPLQGVRAGSRGSRRTGCTSRPAIHRRGALHQAKIPVIWVNRHGKSSRARRSPTPRCEPSATRQAAQGRLTAEACERSRSADALVVTSAFWQDNAVALRAGGEAVLIDSPYLPDELDALPGLLAARLRARRPARHARRLRPSARPARLPGLTLGMGESSVERLRREPGAAQRELRDYDAEFYVERPRRWRSAQVQASRARPARPREW